MFRKVSGLGAILTYLGTYLVVTFLMQTKFMERAACFVFVCFRI
jgi:hypothetical protein